jgi:hypothetical protein
MAARVTWTISSWISCRRACNPATNASASWTTRPGSKAGFPTSSSTETTYCSSIPKNRVTFSEGYERLWLIGDTTVVIRNSIDLKAWFATESEVSEFAPRYPQFIMCLYNLDLYDGETVMYVLRTHTRIFVNGLIIANPYYIPKRQFLGGR